MNALRKTYTLPPPPHHFKAGMNTFGELRGSVRCFAERGGEGGSHFKTGRDAPETTVFVPPGTVVTDLEVTSYYPG